jgi:4-hydroxybenzoate polyprenyltransferase
LFSYLLWYKNFFSSLVLFFSFCNHYFYLCSAFSKWISKKLRKVSYLKIFLVAFVWAGVSSSIPLLVHETPIGVDLILSFLQRMFFVLVLIFPFEIRDMHLDIKDIKTLPQKIGVEKTKKVGFVLLLFSLTLEFLLTESLFNKNIFLIICFILLLFLMRSSQNQSKYYSSFWVESLSIFWWILLLVF